MKKQNIVYILLLLCLMCAAIFIYNKGTEEGIGLVSDSVNYINGARSITQGKGYFRESGGGTLKPITNFPPLYSMILAIPMKLGMEGIPAAKLISLIFFVLNVIAVTELIRIGSGCPWTALLGGGCFLALSPFLSFQFYAMSEPVYFFCTLLAFILFLRGTKEERFTDWLGCGLACGCAFLARYIGAVSLCAIFGAVIVFVKKKGKALGGLFGGALPLFASWLIRNQIVSGNASNRQVLSHWVTADDLKHGVMIFWRWLWPERYGNLEIPLSWMNISTAVFLALSLLFVLAMMTAALRGRKFSPSAQILWTYLLFIPGYLAFVVLTISLFDASVNIEERILFPAFMVGLLALFTLTGTCIRGSSKILGGALLAFCLALGIGFGQDTSKHFSRLSESGFGWGWEGWNESPAIQIMRELPESLAIYCNQPEAVSLWAGRGAFALLDPIDPSSEQRREGYDETLAEIRRQVFDGESAVVFFGADSWADGDNWVTELCEGLPEIYRDTSEWVFGILPQTAE